METAILAFGTIGFWVTMSIAVILMLTCINFQKGAAATFVAIGAALLLQFYGGMDIFGTIKNNPMTVIYYVLGYGVLGAGTAVFKWWRYVRNNRHKYDEAKAEYLDDNDNLDGWERYRELGNYNGIKFLFAPAARRHKAAITMWMTYWPLVLVWTVIDDPVRKFFRMIYDSLGSMLERISAKAFEDADNDLPARARRKVGSDV